MTENDAGNGLMKLMGTLKQTKNDDTHYSSFGTVSKLED